MRTHENPKLHMELRYGPPNHHHQPKGQPVWALTMIYIVGVVTVGWALLVAAARDAERLEAWKADIDREAERRQMLARIVEDVRMARD